MLFDCQKLDDDSGLSSALRWAIRRAYATFADYRPDLPLRVCRCPSCVDDETARALVATPLRGLPSRILSAYTDSAHGYDEDEDGATLRHYLPRYFELIALNDPPSHNDMPFCLTRLKAAQYRSRWSRPEIDAIDAFFDALLLDKLLDVSLQQWPAGFRLAYPIDDLLEMVVLAGGDLARLLDRFESAPDPHAALHIAELCRNLRFDHAPDFHSVLIAAEREARRDIGAFLAAAGHPARLERAFFALEGEPILQQLISDGQQTLAAIVALSAGAA